MDLGVYRTAVSTTLKLQFENEMYFISRICLSFAINTPEVSKCGSNHDIPLIRPLEILQHFFFCSFGHFTSIDTPQCGAHIHRESYQTFIAEKLRKVFYSLRQIRIKKGKKQRLDK